VAGVVALTLQTAKNIGLALIIVCVLFALLVVKQMAGIAKKVIGVVILAAIAFGVWSQRASLQSCADRVRAQDGITQATCHFFGTDITIRKPVSG
jgi:hypothetical protein